MKIKQIKGQIANLEKRIASATKKNENIVVLREEFIKEKIAEAGQKIADKYLGSESKKAIDEIKETKQIIADVQKTKDPKYCDKDGNIKSDLYEKPYKLRDKSEGQTLDDLAKASDNEKIIGAYYLSDIEAIKGGCHGFGGHKNPSTCGGCVAGQITAAKLDLGKYYDFCGDRCYKISEKTKINALEEVAGIKVEDELKKLNKNPEESKKKLENLNIKKKQFEEKESAYHALNKSGMDYEKVEHEMPHFFKGIISPGEKGNVMFATADIKKNVGVMLIDQSSYYGSGGCEYGVTVKVVRDGKSKGKYFKWRDAYSSGSDNTSLYFQEAKIVKVTDKAVTVNLKSNSSSRNETFSLAKSKSENKSKNLKGILGEQAQEKWQKKYDHTKKDLLEQHYRSNASQADYIGTNYLTHGVPTTGRQVPYDRSNIIDEHVDAKNGIAAIVIKAQIDAAADRGKQYEWVGYVFDKTGKAKRVYRDCAYQAELKDGKRIETKASDLLRRIK